MSLSSIIRWFKPREMIFFDLLEMAVDNLCEAIKHFHNELETNDPARWGELRHRMKDFEHNGDNVHKIIVDKLDQTFVTPIEREDILQLSHSIDDVLDLVDAVSERLVMYGVGHIIHPPVIEITKLLIEGATDLTFLVRSLRNMSNVKEIRERIRKVQQMEDQADAVYNASMGNLFATVSNAIELIKWKEIIEDLEDASDSITLVAKVVGSTVTKNA
jgi:predicted phosphate transport protein (TIGR00153 family)